MSLVCYFSYKTEDKKQNFFEAKLLDIDEEAEIAIFLKRLRLHKLHLRSRLKI